MKRSYSFILALLLILFCLQPCPFEGNAHAETLSEQSVKAAFLYRFPEFIEWPANAFPQGNSPFLFGILGEQAIAHELERITSGKTIQGRPILIKSLGEIREAANCQVLFVGATNIRELSSLLDPLLNKPLLTVGEQEGFLEAGGMINFSLEEKRVRFSINRTAAERDQIKISSKLLQLAAKVVHP